MVNVNAPCFLIGGARMSIVKYRRGDRVYVYDSQPVWDPVKKQARPKRTYLGMEDPETGELIPSSGKAGRKPKSLDSSAQDRNPGSVSDQRYQILYESLQKEHEETLKKKEQAILSLRQEVAQLRELDRKKTERIRFLQKQIRAIADQMDLKDFDV